MPECFCQAMRCVALGRLLLESKCAVRSSARVAVLFGCRHGAPNSCALHSVRNGQEGIAHACARSFTRSDGVDSSIPSSPMGNERTRMIMSLPVYRSSFNDHHNQRQLGNISQLISPMLMPSRDAWSAQRHRPFPVPQASRRRCADCVIFSPPSPASQE